MRNLRVEEWGDFAHDDIKPLIRLKGRWLQDMGFAPGSRVILSNPRPGVIELRAAGVAVDGTTDATKETERQGMLAALDQANANYDRNHRQPAVALETLPEAVGAEWHRLDRRDDGKGSL